MHKLGWKPDSLDMRDRLAAAPRLLTLPPMVDLRSHCPPVYDQGQLGSCTGNAIAGAIDFERAKQGMPSLTPSRLFIYYSEREREGTVDQDAGAMIRDGIKCVAKLGVCPESRWPYDVSQFAVKPPGTCYSEAVKHQTLRYLRLTQNLASLKGSLALGYPFVFGFTVYSDFESAEVAKTGIVPMPVPEEAVLGGHAVMCVGYRDADSVFIVRNSWGEHWGDAGYFYLPYPFVSNPHLASDFWSIRLEE